MTIFFLRRNQNVNLALVMGNFLAVLKRRDWISLYLLVLLADLGTYLKYSSLQKQLTFHKLNKPAKAFCCCVYGEEYNKKSFE